MSKLSRIKQAQDLLTRASKLIPELKSVRKDIKSILAQLDNAAAEKQEKRKQMSLEAEWRDKLNHMEFVDPATSLAELDKMIEKEKDNLSPLTKDQNLLD